MIQREPTLHPGPCLVFLDSAKKGLRYPNLRCKSSLHLQFKLTVLTHFHHCHITPALISSISSISIFSATCLYHQLFIIILTITTNTSFCPSNCYQHQSFYCCTYTSYQFVHTAAPGSSNHQKGNLSANTSSSSSHLKPISNLENSFRHIYNQTQIVQQDSDQADCGMYAGLYYPAAHSLPPCIHHLICSHIIVS